MKKTLIVVTILSLLPAVCPFPSNFVPLFGVVGAATYQAIRANLRWYYPLLVMVGIDLLWLTISPSLLPGYLFYPPLGWTSATLLAWLLTRKIFSLAGPLRALGLTVGIAFGTQLLQMVARQLLESNVGTKFSTTTFLLHIPLQTTVLVVTTLGFFGVTWALCRKS